VTVWSIIYLRTTFQPNLRRQSNLPFTKAKGIRIEFDNLRTHWFDADMLDTFEILTTSGVVLWSRKYTSVSPAVVNNFIADVFIEEKSSAGNAKDGASAAANPPYKYDQHTLRWTFEKELGIIFVVSIPKDSTSASPVR